MDPFGWNSGKYQPKNAANPSPSNVAVIPAQAQEFNDMLSGFNEKKVQVNYVMSHQEALNKIARTYPSEMGVTANEKITDLQAAKHIYHAKGVGVNPEDYGMTQKQLMEISKDGGLTEYVRKGNPLPSVEHVNAYQKALKSICENAEKRTNSKYYYKHCVTPATVYYNEDKKVIVSFNQTTGDLITGDKQRPNVFNRFLTDNTLGGQQWINKWN